MKTNRILSFAVGLLALGFTSQVRAEDAAKPSGDFKAKLEELRGLPPEERKVKQREFMQSLTPEQRQEARAAMKKAHGGVERPGAKKAAKLTPEQVENMKKKVAALEKKKAAGTITQQESKQLEHLKARLESGGKAKQGKKRHAKKGGDETVKEAAKP